MPEVSQDLPGNATELRGGPGHLLSDGRYRVALTWRGSGRSEAEGAALTRWRGDVTEDADGFAVFLRDLDSGACWSAGLRPGTRLPASYAWAFSDGLAAFTREDDGIATHLEVAVVPGLGAEVRRLTLANGTDRPRRLEVTTCVEAALNAQEAFAAHPAFSNLFVETSWIPGARALAGRRRPRGADEKPIWMAHWLATEAAGLSYESDRARFRGRGRVLAQAEALGRPGPLAGGLGSVLDPMMALRVPVELAPGAQVSLAFGLGFARTREALLAALEVLSGAEAVEAGLRAAAAGARKIRGGLGLDERGSLALTEIGMDLLLGACGRGRATEPGTVLPEPAAGDPSRPLLVASLRSARDLPVLHQALAAKAYLGALGFPIRLALLASGAPSAEGVDLRLDPDALPEAELQGLLGQARLLLASPRVPAAPAWAPPAAARFAPLVPAGPQRPPAHELVQRNGLGGFTPDGTEYVLEILPGADGHPRLPPMPWSNVIANPAFGLITTERGISTTWSRNSRLHRMTPWLNDPVADPLPETLFVRDEDALTCWSLTPGPAGGHLAYTVRHGFGITRWESEVDGLAFEVAALASPTEPFKLVTVEVRNLGSRRRRLSLFWCAQLALGERPEQGAGRIDTRREGDLLLAWNTAPGAFSGPVAFARACASQGRASCTTDRAAFLGPEGRPEAPDAVLRGAALDGCAGRVLDPCFAFQQALDVAPGAASHWTVIQGEGADPDQARTLAAAAGDPARVREEVRAFWSGLLSRVQVHTPEPALDLMVNGWLPYQNLACRMWGRTAYYQSGGAFGFRDQLQDAAGLIHLLPGLTRDQILLHAAHQFEEGDVLHWWHPGIEQGIRTKFSDDLLWLPFVVAYYLRTTEDRGVLDARAPYLTARALADGEDEAYLRPEASGTEGDVYDHCCRALDLALRRTGVHGLPLMGTGDWNDGMNRVGREGRGESVWLAFFLRFVLDAFLPLCEERGDAGRLERYRDRIRSLDRAVLDAGWDGAWFRRAYYDDGAPLGSASNTECRIDCIAQAWAVISGAAPREKAAQALAALEANLMDRRARIIRLLTPAFDACDHDPGYIKGYIPGVRENGGQYTHGALWAVKALAEAGELDKAAQWLAILSPVSHTAGPDRVAAYQTEPYVVAADIYGEGGHTGRGGWTWYTGSAGWMYRIALEDVLGVHREAGALCVRPSLPPGWDHAGLDYRTERGSVALRLERDPALPAGALEVEPASAAERTPAGDLRVALDGDLALRIRVGA